MKKYVPGFVLLLTSCLSACGQKTFDEKINSLVKGTVPIIHAEELKQQYSNVILLDTRAPKEYEVSHLQGARMIDYDRFKTKEVKDIPKDAEIVVYCSVGYRSERIGEKLQKAGYTNVRNLYGGIFDWKNKEFEIVDMSQQPTDSVHTYNKNWSQWLYKGVKVYE